MASITAKNQLNENIYEIEVNAPRISTKGKPGQFVIIRLHDKGERVPLTLADTNPKRGSITLVFQVQGKTSLELSLMSVGDDIKNVVGPLGKPTEIEKFGTVVLLGGGCGCAPVYPQVKALHDAGNQVICIMGFKNKDFVFWEKKMAAVCDELIITTDDGSYGRKGFTTTILKDLIEEGHRIDRIISIGPLIMMANTVKITKPANIPTIVSLNALMVDGTGMCGSCRVTTPEGIKFSCVDGPDMNGFEIDFEELMNRNSKYQEHEQKSLSKFTEKCKCEERLEHIQPCAIPDKIKKEDGA